MRRALVVLAACKPIAAVAPTAAPPPPPSNLPITAAVIPTLARAVVHDLPTRDDGFMLVTAGSLRAAVGAKEIRFADDYFAEPIVSATHAAAGWVFTTADGLVTRADHFLGPVTKIGQMPPLATPVTHSCGRALAITPDGKLVTSDGRDAVAELSPEARRVKHAAFVDPDHGMIIVDSGDLLATRDGGKTFRKIDLHVATVLDVECVDERYRVTTSTGTIDLDKAAVQLPPGPAASAPYVPGLDERVTLAAVRRYPRLVVDEIGGTVTDDGRVLVPVRDKLRPVDQAGEIETGARRCASGRWGGGLGLACGGSFYAVDTKALDSQLVTAPRFDPHVVFSNDGDHFAWHCGLDGMSRRGAQWCVGDRAGHMIEAAGDRFLSILGMRDGALIAAGDNKIVAITGATTKDRVVLGPLPDRAYADQLSLSGDGTVVAGASTTTRQLVGLTVASGLSYMHPLPGDATRAAMATATVGIAVARDRSHVWATRDAGVTWQPVPVGVTGALVAPDRPSRRARQREPERGAIRCTTQRCVIDERVVVAFDGVPLGAPSNVLAATTTEAAGATHAQTVDLMCEPIGTSRHVETQRDVDPHLGRKGRFRIDTANVTATITSLASRYEATWQGIDALGEYQATTPNPTAKPGPGRESLYLLAATRDGLVVAEGGKRPSIVWIAPKFQVVAPSIGPIDDVLILPDQIALMTDSGDTIVIDKTGKISRGQIVADPTLNVGLGFVDGHVVMQSESRVFPIGGQPRDLDGEISSLNICVGAGPISQIRSFREDIPGSWDYQPKLRRAYLQASCIQAIELSNSADGEQMYVPAVDGQLRTDAYRAMIDAATIQRLRCGHRP